MIPLRIAIAGFMSYREKVELVFEGAPIWVLTGDNGAGKSTVFDAITFALFGVHRHGKQSVEEIINRNSDSLLIEFDFMLGEDCYRIRRTASRQGRPSFQVIHLSGPHVPSPNRPSPQPVPETDSRDGFSRWVNENLGLDEKSFLMSVVLRQGESDALLKATPAARHELLSRLVDLSRYQRLHERANEHHKNAQSTVKHCEQRLKELPVVEQKQLEEVSQAIQQAKDQILAARAELERVAGLKVHAQNWAERQSRREQLSRASETMHQLIAQAGAIERDAAREADLRVRLPQLKRLFQLWQEGAEHRRRAQEKQRAAEQLAAQVGQAKAELEAADAQVERLQQEKADAEAQQLKALDRQHKLAQDISRLDDLADLQREAAELEQALQVYPADLSASLEQAQREAQELDRLQVAQPWLNQFIHARAQWRTATAALETARNAVQEALDRVTAADSSRQAAENELAVAQGTLTKAERQLERSRTLLDNVAQQLARFDEIADQPACPYCGQTLTADHLAAERDRLTKEQAERQGQLVAATIALEQATTARMNAERLLKDRQDEYKAAVAAQYEASQALQSLEQKCRDAQQTGQSALDELQTIREYVRGLPHATEALAAFVEPALTEEDQADFRDRVVQFNATQQRLANLRQMEMERASRQKELEIVYRKLQSLELDYPPARAEALRTEYQAAQAAQAQAAQEIQRLAGALQDAQQQQASRREQLRQLEEARQREESEAREASKLAERDEAAAARELNELPEPWQDAARQVTADQLRAWDQELEALQGAGKRLEQLRRSEAELAATERQLAEVHRDLEAIPVEARRPVGELEDIEAQARRKLEQAEAARQEATRTQQALLYQREERARLAAEKRSAERRASLYKQLAQLLGREYLQRYLLQQAEASIVTYANAVLDRCSGGTLRMELRQNEDEGGQPAFDLVVHNLATSDEPLAVWLLSGSQRFRVAISLALGIGQFASDNARRIESVIIDEGFGSLDRNGLRDMAEALRDLSSTLRRVILVSHQEDFARTFPNRYHIALVDGASRLVDEPE